MKIFSAEQLRAADAFTIENEPISSLQLMERASAAFVECFMRHFNQSHAVHVVCGSGNNGGDGVVIGRLLKAVGYQVQTTVILTKSPSEDLMAQMAQSDEELHRLALGDNLNIAPVLVIDALFGSGLNRPIEGKWEQYVHQINTNAHQIVAVDLPSGLMADQMTPGHAIIQAQLTIALHAPKLSFFIPETGGFVGRWEAVDIGLNQDFVEKQDCPYQLILPSIVNKIPARGKFQHKGDFGRVQNIAGSYGKMGAAILSSRAIMRSGAGLLTTHIPHCGVAIMQTAVPEAMISADKHAERITSAPIDTQTDVFCVGPGLGTSADTTQWLLQFLSNSTKPVVLDADALNIISQSKNGWKHLPIGSLITPHVGEFHRLFGNHEDGFERLKTAQKVAQERKIVIVLKGAHTAVVCPDKRVYFNTTGNPGMATAGSGDVLAGMITGWWAQGMSAELAARVAVYLHGLAGDKAAKKHGEYAIVASDLLE